MGKILAPAGYQTVGNANRMAAADQLFCQVGADETGTASYQVMSHIAGYRSKPRSTVGRRQAVAGSR
jgi:hypothetical protein